MFSVALRIASATSLALPNPSPTMPSPSPTTTSALKLNLRRFFQLTSLVLIFFAAGLVGHAIGEFNELGWLPAISAHVYNLNAVMPETSLVGQFLKALFGYNASPSLTETIGYLGYFVGVFGLTRWAARKAVGKATVMA